MAWILCVNEKTTSNIKDFFRGIDVWIEKPHVVNRRLCCSNLICKKTFRVKNVNIQALVDHIEIHKKKITQVTDDDYSEMLNKYFDNFKEESKDENLIEIDVQLKQLIPKQVDRYSPMYIVICKDISNGCVVTIPINNINEVNHLTTPYPFKFTIEIGQENYFRLCVYSDSQETLMEEPCVNWLIMTLFPKVKKWCEIEPDKNIISSLKFVPADKYSALYSKLKCKYGPELVEKWTEKTDPLKYVYEDIAIATYLLILWENERKEKKIKSKQSFIDFGCGNGLLVYLLCKEGHPGIGLDVRKRKIWDMFDGNLELQVAAVNPSINTTYPGYDWFIGNHSDELTPWIPVMAAKSSYNTRFFLLPCCFHDFDCKFQRKVSSKSQYESYLDYVGDIIEVCGFEKQIDKLRIPSTKRICFLGMNRNYEENEIEIINDTINKFIRNKSNKLDPTNDVDVSSREGCTSTFTPRSAVEPVLNCTKLDKNFIKDVVDLIATDLLNYDKNTVEISNDDGEEKFWKTGGQRSLPELAELLGKVKLLELKSQCGGLQTLLRNHSHIFQVLNGCVSLRNYTKSAVNRTKRKQKQVEQNNIKRRNCWFYENHPDGCILTADQCTFVH